MSKLNQNTKCSQISKDNQVKRPTTAIILDEISPYNWERNNTPSTKLGNSGRIESKSPIKDPEQLEEKSKYIILHNQMKLKKDYQRKYNKLRMSSQDQKKTPQWIRLDKILYFDSKNQKVEFLYKPLLYQEQILKVKGIACEKRDDKQPKIIRNQYRIKKPCECSIKINCSQIYTPINTQPKKGELLEIDFDLKPWEYDE